MKVRSLVLAKRDKHIDVGGRRDLLSIFAQEPEAHSLVVRFDLYGRLPADTAGRSRGYRF
jgi:hypothetical protein